MSLEDKLEDEGADPHVTAITGLSGLAGYSLFGPLGIPLAIAGYGAAKIMPESGHTATVTALSGFLGLVFFGPVGLLAALPGYYVANKLEESDAHPQPA